MFETDSFSWKDAISSEWEGKPIIRLGDLLILTVLTDLKYAQNSEHGQSENYKGADYSKIIDVYEGIIVFRGVILGVLEKLKKGKGIIAVAAWLLIIQINLIEKMLKNVVKKLIGFIIHSMALGIREYQNLEGFGTNPSHTQLAKDDKGHPLHEIAGQLARIAVADMGNHYMSYKEGFKSKQQLINLAKEYLAHPKDVSWMDMTVLKWATSHIGEVNKAKNKGILDALHKKHLKHIETLKAKGAQTIEEIMKSFDELKEFYEKTEDRLDDLNIVKKQKKVLENIYKELLNQ